ncbi:hypothetical protein E4U21_000622 [Claviceps maximensis]|nr:hypothetical protein E4U21_000622 [Claviceps maximensis]
MGLTEVFLRGAVVLLGLVPESAAATRGSQTVATGGASRTAVPDAITSRASVNIEVCEARTINYITHALPQSCLTTSWKLTAPAPTPNTATDTQQNSASGATVTDDELLCDSVASSSTDQNATATTPAAAEPTVTTFMSFEDWKEMMLRRAGQDPQDLRTRRVNDHHASDRYSSDIGHAGLGEEGEISLNFEHYDGGDGMTASVPKQQKNDGVEQQVADTSLTHEDGKTATVHLSKDAGKTCKERFSYSSFDAGATILKTSPGAKNAKAILVENKDTYMLLECDTSSKYVIIELSDDISVDTVVLANFEFFSSMIRHFRVSVSDRYPVKIDKWRDLGTFEARNSRDIQPFLVENPQIWAKYVRIEFLTHFGNEYYCPISLLRIHGSRMLDSWKDSEINRDDDVVVAEDEIGSPAIAYNPSENLTSDQPFNVQHIARVQNVSVWRRPFEPHTFSAFDTTCPIPVSENGNFAETSSGRTTTIDETSPFDPDSPTVSEIVSAGVVSSAKSMPHSPRKPTEASSDHMNTKTATAHAASQDQETQANGPSFNDTISTTDSTATNERLHNVTTTSPKVAMSGGQAMKHRSTGTTGPPAASPTMQEGFFHAITKRLQHVESNLTLSMKYVEDQSKHVQEALQSGEQKQQAHIAMFLDDLNKTVLAELHNLREQYDQMWQSTVIALESQRDRSERDMMALSTRLNLLADEVVFQKRMAIVQAIILLSCLFLIIFSRGVSLPSLAPLLDQSSATAFSPSNLSQSTSRQLAYEIYKDIELPENCGPSSTSQSPLRDNDQPRADPDRCSSPSSVRCKTDVVPQVITSRRTSSYQKPHPHSQVSSHLSSSRPTEQSISDRDGSAITYFKSHKPQAVYLNDVRKPLPSLPEHSHSHNST